MKKKFLLLTMIMCLLGGINSVMAQDVVTIGDGTTQQYYAPFDAYSANSGSQTYYLSSEIGKPGGGTIDKISYNVAIANNYNKNIRVYMRNTEDDCFPRTSNGKYEMVNMTNEDLVFDGIVNPGTIGWMTIDLTNDFNYEGKNLLIAIYDATGATNQIDAKFNAYSSRINNNADYRTIYKSGTSGNPVSNYTVNFTAYGSSPNIQLTITDAGSSTPTAPDAPALVSPENLATDIFNPALNFTLGNHTEHYQILMGEGTNEITAVTGWVEKTNNTVSYQTNNLKSNTAYSWKVVARCSDGSKGYLTTESEVYTFTTRNITAAPGAISNVSPEDGAELDINPTLSWTFGENTESYKVLFAREGEDLFIAKDWTNTKNAEDETFNTSAIKLDGEYDDPGLDANTTYQWQIVTKNSVGETESEVFTFTKLGAPNNVTPTNPVNGATGVSNDVTLTWNFDATTTHYRVLFAEGNPEHLAYQAGTAYNWLEVNGETGSFETTDQDLKPNTIYYWCVDVKNGAGQRTQYQGGESVQVFSFTTTDVFPATYNTPGNGALVGNTTADLTWSYGAGNTANEYQVLLGTDERDLEVVQAWTSRPSEGTGLVGSGSYTATELSPNTKYYWQVNTRKGTTTKFGAVWSFVTTLDVPQNVTATPENVYPGNTYPYNAVATVTWDAIADATYNVYVNGEKYNTEALTTNTCDVILAYNMDPGHSIQVSAIYPELGESEKSEAANVKVTGYVNVNGYVKDENENAIEGATVTLVGTDEFGVEYEDEIATTNEDGAYSGRVYAGTYNIVVEKDPYEDEISELINFEYNNTVGYNVTLSADFIFTVSFKNVTADKISVYASNDNWTSPKIGNYNVYIKEGEEIIVGPKLAWFSADGETAVYHSEVINEDWFGLENGTYQIGVEMYGKNHINWRTIEREYSIFTKEGDWSDEENWRGVPGTDADVYIYAPATIAEDDVVAVKNVTIQKDGSLTINGSLTADNVSNEFGIAKLCINDGGQLRQTKNAELSGRFVKSINAPTNWDATSNVDGWQFISAPVADRAISAFVSVDVDYDLFKYDGTKEGAEWVNYKQTQEEIDNVIPNDFETTFQQGRGYLASYQEGRTFIFSGELNNATTFDFALTAFDDEKEWSKFTLLGNPFTFNMNIANLVGTGMEAGVAVINETGNGYSYMTNGEVKVGEGFFVKTAAATASLSYSEGAKRGEENVPSINLIATSKAGNDNVIIRFADEENEGFNKLDNFDRSIAEIYVGNRYAIMSYDENTTEVEVSFHANEMGNYTIAAVPSGKFQTLTLVDRFTGIETNLLVEDYHFIATSSEDVNRFIVKLAVSGQQSAVSDNFVYQSGEELIVDAEGRVQIIDVMGRVVYSDDVESTNNRIDVSGFRNGTYMVRVINGSEVKVEKVVIY